MDPITGDFLPGAVCSRIAYTATNTTCACTLAPPPGSTSSRRQLSAGVSADGSLTVVSQGVESATAFLSEFISPATTMAPTPAPTAVLATLTFKIVGVSFDDANKDDFKLGVRKAVANATTPHLLLSEVGPVTVLQSAAAALQRRQLSSGSSVSISVSILAASSSGTTVASQLQSVTAASLTTALASALPAFAGALSATGVSVALQMPTHAPTAKPEEKAGSALPQSAVAAIVAVLGGVFVIVAFVYRERISAALGGVKASPKVSPDGQPAANASPKVSPSEGPQEPPRTHNNRVIHKVGDVRAPEVTAAAGGKPKKTLKDVRDTWQEGDSVAAELVINRRVPETEL